jgi:sugar fermentation stimulation protein A
MKFEQSLVHGRLIKRYKRFLADIILDDGSQVTAHCTNSGSMKTCLEEDAEVYLSPVNDPKRKTKFTWEMIKINGDWVGINTNHPNRIVYEAMVNGEVDQLKGYTEIKREQKFDDSRFDVMARNEEGICFVEVKNVTMKEGDFALFPDAKTERGRKHLETLIKVKQQGMRAVMFYVIQRQDVSKFGPAWEIDPNYAESLRKATDAGVEVIAMMAEVSPAGIKLVKELPFYPELDF